MVARLTENSVAKEFMLRFEEISSDIGFLQSEKTQADGSTHSLSQFYLVTSKNMSFQ